jgi:hypothetical protein
MGRWLTPLAAVVLLATPPALHLLLEVWWAPVLVPLACAIWISVATRRAESRDRGRDLVLFVVCATLWFLAVPLFLALRRHA